MNIRGTNVFDKDSSQDLIEELREFLKDPKMQMDSRSTKDQNDSFKIKEEENFFTFAEEEQLWLS